MRLIQLFLVGGMLVGWMLDGAASLSWVALSVFGDQLRTLDYHTITPVPISVEGGDPADRAVAYRFGAANQPGLIVAWAYQRDATVGRPKLWQPWLKPEPVRLAVNAPRVELIDLYDRGEKTISVVDKSVVIPVGEEPVYVRELP